MRTLKFLAGLGTILFFAGIYCFKALRQRNVTKEEIEDERNSVISNRYNILLILAGSACIIGGLTLIYMAFRPLIYR